MSGTTVQVSLTPELSDFLESRLASGRYQTTSEVFREALQLLQHHDEDREQALEQLKAKLSRGSAQADNLELADGDQAFEEFRVMLSEPRSKHG